jgi:hypothetical protein
MSVFQSVLAIATILGGIAAAWFFAEKWRAHRRGKKQSGGVSGLSQNVEAQPQLVRWDPSDGLPAGIWINDRNGLFVLWPYLRSEIEQRLLNQLGRRLPHACTAVVRDHFGRKDWTVRILGPAGDELGHIWFGGDPENQWRFDGLVRVGRPLTDQVAEVWQTFQRCSDGSYRRVGLND